MRSKQSNLSLVAQNTLAQVVGTLTSLAFTVGGARLLSIEDYGELRYVMALLPLLMVFSMPGFDTVTLRKSSLGERIPLGSIFRQRIMTASIGSFVVLLLMFFLAQKLSATLAFLLLATALLLPLFETGTGYRNYLLGRGLQSQGTLFLLRVRLYGFAIFVSLSLLCLYSGKNMIWIYPAWLIANIIPTLFAFSKVAFRCETFIPHDRSKLGDISTLDGLTTTLAGLIYTLAFSLDKLWIRMELGAEQLAMYALLIMVPLEFGKIVDSSIPLFYRKIIRPIGSVNFVNIGIYVLMMALIMLSYICAFYNFSELIFGEPYRYSMKMVVLSSLIIPSLSLEYAGNHIVFIKQGSRGTFFYSASNLIVTGLIVPIGLMIGGMSGLILLLFLKQLLLPTIFIALPKGLIRGL